VTLLIALAATAGSHAQAPAARSRLPAIREGVFLSSVRGYFVRSLSDPGLLAFRIEESAAQSGRRALLVLPCDPAEDVKELLRDPTEDTPTRFEVTGEVFDFEGRAFILPVAVVALRNPPAPPMLARTAPAGLAVAGPARPDGPRAPRIDAYAVEEADELGSTPVLDVPRDRMAHEPDPTLFPGLDDGMADEIERRLDAGIARAGVGTAVKRPIASAGGDARTTTATRVLQRRATVLRDPLTGVWRARFATGIPGSGPDGSTELAMEILPSVALERLARSVRERPVGTTWLVSGEVVSARGRNFLVLTRATEPPASRFESP
jgi:hypothetical protein